MAKALTRISVRVVDALGGLEVLHGDSLVEGELLNAPNGLTPGQPIRVRMQMHEGTSELVEVVGQVRIDDDVALMTGLEFDIEVTKMTRAISAPPPSLPEGFSELPTLHMPQHEQLSPVADEVDTPRAVTLPSDLASGVDEEAEVTLLADRPPDEEINLSEAAEFLNGIDEVFGSDESDAEEDVEDRLELTQLEREIDDLDLEEDPSIESPIHAQAPRDVLARPVLDVVEVTDADARIGERAPYEDSLPAHNPVPAHNIVLEVDDEPSLDEPTGIVGTLREMSLCELVQSMEIARKTAQVVVSPKDMESGSIFVDAGRVVWAELGELLGEEAFYVLGRQERGTFRMRFHVSAPGRNVTQPTPYLILEALRRVDEGRASGEFPMAEAREQLVKERLPSAREVVVAAQRAANRSERRRVKTKPPQRPKSTPPTRVEPVERVAEKVARTVTEPAPRAGGSLFASFFEEASRESSSDNLLDEDDTLHARVTSSDADSNALEA